MTEQIKLEVPLRLRKGTLKHNQLEAIDSAITGLNFILQETELKDLSNLEMLDYGCGVKYTQAFIQKDMYPKLYAGVDIDAKMVKYLQNNVKNDKFIFRMLPFHNDMYNPNGKKMHEKGDLKLNDRKFDLAIALSVFTHLNSHDAGILFKIISRYLSKKGKFFFTVFINDELTDTFIDLKKDRPMAKTVFNSLHFEKLITDSGLKIEKILDKNAVFKTKKQYILCK